MIVDPGFRYFIWGAMSFLPFAAALLIFAATGRPRISN